MNHLFLVQEHFFTAEINLIDLGALVNAFFLIPIPSIHVLDLDIIRYK